MTRLFVVASERHVERLAGAGLRGVTRAWLFDRLIAALLPEVAFATPLEARVALAEIAALAGETSGGVDAIDAALSLLRDSDVEADALSAVAEGAGPTAERASRLAVAMRELDARLLRSGLVDGRRGKGMLATRLASAAHDREPGLVVVKVAAARELHAQWLLGWTPSEARLWRALDAALTRVGGRALAELPSFERRLDAERERDPLEVVWDDLALRLEDPPAQRAIEPVLGDLTLTTPLPEASRGRVELRVATDARAEAKAAADAIARALAAGTPVDRIAVGVLDADDATVRALVRTLAEAGVATHDARTAPRSSLLAVVREALELAGRGLDRARTAALLRSDYLDADLLTAAHGRRSRPALLELAAALEETPTEPADDPIGALVATVMAARNARPEHAALIRAFGERLMSVEPSATRAEHAARSRTLLRELGLGPRADAALMTACATDVPMDSIDASDVSAHFDDLTSWQALVGALDDMSRASAHLGSAVLVSGAAFRHELWRAVERRARRSVGARAGAVRLVGLAELAAEELSLLVVCSATADSIPGFGEGSALVTAALGNALRARDPLAAPPAQPLAAARRLAAIAWAASRAERVVLTRATHDESGTTVAAAPLVQWLGRAGVESIAFGAGVVATRPWTARDRALAVLAFAPEHAISLAPDAARRARVEHHREAFHQRGADLDMELVGRLRQDAVVRAVLELETGGGARPLATTALEQFATCAFRGFARSVLGGREELLADDTPSRREEGTLVHDLLRAAFEATLTLWSERPRDRERIVKEGLAAAAARLGSSARGLRRVSQRRLLEEVSAVLRAGVDDEEWDFALAERSFGEGGPWPTLTLQADARLSLGGTIDRIDLSRDGAAVRVVDYKRNSKAFSATELGESLLQLPVYARVAARELGRSDAQGRYVLTQAALAADNKQWAAQWQALGVTLDASPLVERLLDIVRSVRQGVVLPQPRNEKACRTCDFDGVCRKPRFAIPPDEQPT